MSLTPEQQQRVLEIAADLAREGRTGELLEFLDHGVPVDLTDHDGNSLLMLETPLRKTAADYGPFWNTYAHTFFIVPLYGINRPYTTASPLVYAWRAGSKHPGGAQGVMGDNVTRFFSENMDQRVLTGLGSISGAEVLGNF